MEEVESGDGGESREHSLKGDMFICQCLRYVCMSVEMTQERRKMIMQDKKGAKKFLKQHTKMSFEPNEGIDLG